MMTDHSSRASEGSQRRRSVWRVARGVDHKWQKIENYVYLWQCTIWGLTPCRWSHGTSCSVPPQLSHRAVKPARLGRQADSETGSCVRDNRRLVLSTRCSHTVRLCSWGTFQPRKGWYAHADTPCLACARESCARCTWLNWCLSPRRPE